MNTVVSNKLTQRYSWARKTPFFYGWVVVSIASLSMFATTPGQSDTFSIFMDSFVNEFGWSRTFISSLFSGATLLSGCLMFFAGRIVDRIGAKWAAILSATILGTACVILSFVVSPLMLFMGFFLARFSGKGSLDLSASTLAPQWFIKRRAFSIMLVGLGGTAGGVIFPLLNTYLINTYGWREAYRLLAGGLWLIFIPIVLLFLINRPEDAGLHPDNKLSTGKDTPSKDSDAEVFVDNEVSLTQGQALRTSAFWIVTLSVFQASLVGTGVTLHFVSIFNELGHSMTFAAQILSMKTLVAFVTVILAGLVLDKIKRQHFVLALACLVQTGGLIMLAYLKSVPMAYLYTLVSGISGALLAFSVGVLKPNLFGRRYLGGILGVVMAINVIGSAIGPLVFGAAFDIFYGYREVILLSMVLPFVTAVLSLTIRKPVLN
ncbi:MAG: MFS transporter [Chloroflexi bacterium]|nr:MAG: MFS transporter [Chloroflexota bacterium]